MAFEPAKSPLDKAVGMTVYARPEAYVKGLKLDMSPDTFKVIEVGADGSLAIPERWAGTCKEGYGCRGREAVRYVMCKVGVTTYRAVKALEEVLGLRVGYAGLKDANAYTCQFITVKCRPGANLRCSYSILNGAVRASYAGIVERMVKRGELEGNLFIANIDSGNARDEDIRRCLDVLRRKPFPNFYGYQRFGSRRPVSHLIGEALVLGNYREAVDRLLMPTNIDFESPRVVRARKLYAKGLWREALKEFPRSFRTEVRVLRKLLKGFSYRRAMMSLGSWLIKFFIEAYQSYLFNMALSKAIAINEGLDELLSKCEVLPLPHHNVVKNDECSSYVVSVMKEHGFRPVAPALKYLRRGVRNTYTYTKSLQAEFREGELLLRFELKPSSYATVVLREALREGLKV